MPSIASSSNSNPFLDALGHRVERLGRLLGSLGPVPDEWLLGTKLEPRNGVGVSPNKASSLAMDLLPCDTYRQLIGAWRKALKWTDGLDCALSVMLAAVSSTKSVGDQLWCKIIGPASCGKSTLCEAISTNRMHVLAKSTIRGFHSGWKSDHGEDNSLVALVRDKTLVTKDGDTLLQSPNLGQILAEARDLYDSTARTHYRNDESKDYSGVRMTWILCGTSSLRQIDSSELGERFLDCVVMEGIDDDLEDEILWRVANRTDRNMAVESNGSAVTQYEPELAEAMQLTGGYVSHLRENAIDLLSTVSLSDPVKRKIARLGKFVAYMRARPSKIQDENSEREFAARLVSQHIRLAKCLAIVLNRSTVDEEVMRRVSKVAMDTSRGQTLQIVERLAKGISIESRAIALMTNRTDDKTAAMMRFLRQIGVVEIDITPLPNGAKTQKRWKLTDRIARLYKETHDA